MGTTSDLDRVTMIVLRSMRPPLFVLLFVYAVGITGMALIPGYDEQGNPARMSLFHAFYFITYTATTTGFGEIPAAFSDSQRLWAIACLYVGVIAWLYAIGSVIRLLQNEHFTSALREFRFAGSVLRIQEPFYIVCGFGDTGSLLVRGLDDNLLRAVVIDSDHERIKALTLRDYHNAVPGLCADAGTPKHLIDAGIRNDHCVAVVILTEDERTNLKVAVMARFINNGIQVLCRTTSPRIQEHLSHLESVAVINPFEIFAHRVKAAIVAPQLIHFTHWLAGASQRKLDEVSHIPAGYWIVCGYGRMGQWLHHCLECPDIKMTIMDPVTKSAEGVDIRRCHADYASLEQAGIGQAACVVAGTREDSENLSILLAARALNKQVYTIVRQNWHENQLAFDAAAADLIMQTSLITARTILTRCISPHIARLEAHLLEQGEHTTAELIERIDRMLAGDRPHLFRLCIDSTQTPALIEWMGSGHRVKLAQLLRDPQDWERQLRCVPLMIQRADTHILLPESTFRLDQGDDILVCCSRASEATLLAVMNNPYDLHYCMTGRELPRGYFFSRFDQWRRGAWPIP